MGNKALWSIIGVIIGAVLTGAFAIANRQILPIERRVFEVAVGDHSVDNSSHRIAVCPVDTHLIGGRCEVNGDRAVQMISTRVSDGIRQIESSFGGCNTVFQGPRGEVSLQDFCSHIYSLDEHSSENGFFCWVVNHEGIASFSAVAECSP